jgi:hypothetical protein
MLTAVGDVTGRPKTASFTASSSALTVTVGSLSSVEIELVEESMDLDSDALSTLASERAACSGR